MALAAVAIVVVKSLTGNRKWNRRPQCAIRPTCSCVQRLRSCRDDWNYHRATTVLPENRGV